MPDPRKPPEPEAGIDIAIDEERDPFAPPPEQDQRIALVTPKPYALPIVRAPKPPPATAARAPGDSFAPPPEADSTIDLVTPKPFALPIVRAPKPAPAPAPVEAQLSGDAFAPPAEQESTIDLVTPKPFNLPIVRAPQTAPEPVARSPRDSFAPPPEESRAIGVEAPVRRSGPRPVVPPPTAVDAAPVVDAPLPVVPAAPLRLRDRAALRIGVGVGLGLLVGFLFSSPYSHRAERRIAQLRADAATARSDGDPRAATLDAAAEHSSSTAAAGTIALWLLFGAAATGGWLYFTRR